MVVVDQVNGDAQGLRAFRNLPYSLYSGEPLWCPPLRLERAQFFSDRNPFMRHARVAYFLARRGGRPVGRVTAHVDHNYNAFHNARQGFFGFYESEDDPAVAQALMDKAERWVREQGLTSIMGPFNFSTNHEVGFLIKGFERPPVLMMPYTMPYYPELFHRLGYEKAKELIAFWFENVTTTPPALELSADRCAARLGASVRTRHLDLRHLEADLRIVLEIFNEAWSHNWGFVPLTDEEIAHTARELKLIANPKVTLLLYKDDEPAACLICLPDLNEILIRNRTGRLFPTGLLRLLAGRRRIRTVRLLLMGVKSQYRRLGLDTLLYRTIFRDYLATAQYRNAELSWILEDNALMLRVLQRLNADPYKRYLIVRKDLPAAPESPPPGTGPGPQEVARP